jgi:hypothetical protein
MHTEDLAQLFKESKPTDISFDGGEFEITFENGISVTVGVTTEWDMGVFEIESSIEKAAREARWEKERQDRETAKQQAIALQETILLQYPPEQREEIKKAFRSY